MTYGQKEKQAQGIYILADVNPLKYRMYPHHCSALDVAQQKHSQFDLENICILLWVGTWFTLQLKSIKFSMQSQDDIMVCLTTSDFPKYDQRIFKKKVQNN